MNAAHRAPGFHHDLPDAQWPPDPIGGSGGSGGFRSAAYDPLINADAPAGEQIAMAIFAVAVLGFHAWLLAVILRTALGLIAESGPGWRAQRNFDAWRLRRGRRVHRRGR